jgi:hypothetical protein
LKIQSDGVRDRAGKEFCQRDSRHRRRNDIPHRKTTENRQRIVDSIAHRLSIKSDSYFHALERVTPIANRQGMEA